MVGDTYFGNFKELGANTCISETKSAMLGNCVPEKGRFVTDTAIPAAKGTVTASVPYNLTQGDTNTTDKRKRTSSQGSSKPARVIVGAGFVGVGKVSPVELSCSSVSDDVRHGFKGDMVLADYLCVNKRKRDDSLVTDTEQSCKLS